MIHCREVTSWDEAVAYLRGDVIVHVGMLQALERNVPPVPRRVWVAQGEGGEIVGVMTQEDFPHGVAVCVEASVPEAVAPMVDALGSGRAQRFVVRDQLWDALRAAVPALRVTGDVIAMVLTPPDLQEAEPQGQVRRLKAADAPLIGPFDEAERDAGRPPLKDLVAWADGNPGEQAVFGLICEGRLMSFVQFGLAVDNIWEVGMIRTAIQRQREGHAKALLSQAGRRLLEEGRILLYQVAASNAASIRTAEAVGFRRAYRRLSAGTTAASGDNKG